MELWEGHQDWKKSISYNKRDGGHKKAFVLRILWSPANNNSYSTY